MNIILANIFSATHTQPKDAFAWVQLGQVFAEMGDKGQAKFCYDKALKLSPGFREAYRGLHTLTSGEKPSLDVLSEFFQDLARKHPDVMERLAEIVEDARPFHQRLIELRHDYPDLFREFLETLRHTKRHPASVDSGATTEEATRRQRFYQSLQNLRQEFPEEYERYVRKQTDW